MHVGNPGATRTRLRSSGKKSRFSLLIILANWYFNDLQAIVYNDPILSRPLRPTLPWTPQPPSSYIGVAPVTIRTPHQPGVEGQRFHVQPAADPSAEVAYQSLEWVGGPGA